MKKLLMILIFGIMPIVGLYAQYCHTDSLTVRHWNLQLDCNLHFFKGQFVGVLLDGSQLRDMDILFQRIHVDKFIQNQFFESNNDTLAVYEFEQIFKEDSSKNDTILMSNPPYLPESYYLRQYVFVRDANKRYLLVSFQLDRENTELVNNRYCWKSCINIEYNRTYKCFLMIYTKIFCFPPFHTWKRYNDPFYVLYNIDTKEIIYFFVGDRIKN